MSDQEVLRGGELVLSHKQVLESLSNGFPKRSEDILPPEYLRRTVNPSVNIKTADLQTQEEPIEFSTNEILKVSFNDDGQPH